MVSFLIAGWLCLFDSSAATLAAADGDARPSIAAANAAGGSGGRVADLHTAEYFQTLGEACVRSGQLREAYAALQRASDLQNNANVVALKQLATVAEWVREFSASERVLRHSLDLAPDDAEAQAALTNLRYRRSLHLMGSVGGWEPDYVTRARDLGIFVGWFDLLDLYGGYSDVDKVGYRRTNAWADAYLFPGYRFSIRLGIRNRHYTYALSPASSPDQDAYNAVPSVQIEGNYAVTDGTGLSVELEYFRPDFYWNNTLHASNFKVSASIRQTLLGPAYGKFIAVLLRDPDPSSFTADPASGSIRGFSYETQSLFGGALGFDRGRTSAEVMYVPDRDLDRSIAWSVLARARYDFGPFAVQYDLLYDRYESGDSRGFIASRVNMLSVIAMPADFAEVRAGTKILSRESTSVAPFLYVRFKTGL